MRTSIISFSRKGYELSHRLQYILGKKGYEVALYTKSHYTRHCPEYVEDTLQAWCQRVFVKGEAIIFLSSCGVAVRTIAPYVKDKLSDPAVLVMDETGEYIVSLLSGHVGGANALAEMIGKLTGAQPVVTTATDCNGKFAVDVFAEKNHLLIDDRKMAKRITAALLEGEKMGFYSQMPFLGTFPEELAAYEEGVEDKPNKGIMITYNRKERFYEECLYLIPQSIVLGIGCRKGTSFEKIEEVFEEVLRIHSIHKTAVYKVASIDVKAEETGIRKFCDTYRLPFVAFSAEELCAVEGDFAGSDFVREQVGVDNVCERSAVLAAGKGELIQRKYAKQGVTMALAIEKRSVYFE